MLLTKEHIRDYIYCPYKVYLKNKGIIGQISDYQKFQKTLLKQYYQSGIDKAIYGLDKKLITYKTLKSNSKDFKSEWKVILNSEYHYLNFLIHYEILMLTSCNNNKYQAYEPIIISHEEKLNKDIKMFMMILGILIGRIQGHFPARVKGIFGHKSNVMTIKTNSVLLDKAEIIIDDIQKISQFKSKPECYHNKHCDICEFKKYCKEEALKVHDLTLLKGMPKAEIKKLKSRGIFTVTQLSYTFRPRKRKENETSLYQKRHYSLQARAIRDQKIYVFNRPKFLDHPVQIYMDIEGLPNEDYNYLIGLVILEKHQTLEENLKDIPAEMLTSWRKFIPSLKSKNQYLIKNNLIEKVLVENEHCSLALYSFWSDHKDQESDMIKNLIKTLNKYGDYRLFYYGNYEKRYLEKMSKKTNRQNKRDIDRILKRSRNVLSIISANIYFPTYSNRLKDIGKYIGFFWSSADASGLQSIVWRKNCGNYSLSDEFKKRLIIYNIEDCLCVMKLVHFILPVINPESNRSSTFTFTESRKNEIAGRTWGRSEFANNDIECIIKAAYSDYLKEKILLRINRKARRTGTLLRRTSKYRANKRIIVRCRKCKYCGSSNILCEPHKQRLKTVIGLKFSKSLAKQSIVEYSFEKYQCKNCCHKFFSSKMRYFKKYSHTLKAWTVYHYVANRMSLENIERYTRDIFDINISFHTVNRMKSEMAEYYRLTYSTIKRSILSGKMIHVDETKIKLQKEIAYVWVLRIPYRGFVYVQKFSRRRDFEIIS